jgi:hypothetical protein
MDCGFLTVREALLKEVRLSRVEAAQVEVAELGWDRNLVLGATFL